MSSSSSEGDAEDKPLHETQEWSGDQTQHENSEAKELSGDQPQQESSGDEKWAEDQAQYESLEADQEGSGDDVQHVGRMDSEKVPCLFGRKKPVHSALGGGKSAEVILWRNKQMSSAVLASATVIWLLFEWIDYHLIPFICHFLILTLASSLLWSNLSCFIHKSKFKFPEVVLSEDLCNKAALVLRDCCNKAINALREIALGRDVKKLLRTMFGLWIVSIVGSWFDFLTLTYIVFVMTLTMPILYEKNEDRLDSYALKAKSKLQKQYSSFDERVLQRLPKVPFLN